MPVSTRCYIPTSLPQEQVAKTKMLSVEDPAKVEFSIMYSWEGCGYYL